MNSPKTIFCLLVALGQPLASLSNNHNMKMALMFIDVQDCFMEASGTPSLPHRQPHFLWSHAGVEPFAHLSCNFDHHNDQVPCSRVWTCFLFFISA